MVAGFTISAWDGQEPTSGLDATAATDILGALRRWRPPSPPPLCTMRKWTPGPTRARTHMCLWEAEREGLLDPHSQFVRWFVSFVG